MGGHSRWANHNSGSIGWVYAVVGGCCRMVEGDPKIPGGPTELVKFKTVLGD